MNCFSINVVLSKQGEQTLAKASPAAAIQLQIHKAIGFINFMFVYIKKKNPIKMCINSTITYIKELATMQKKLKKIKNLINYEKYKYKKTELILAQNTEHFFLTGRSINQTR